MTKPISDAQIKAAISHLKRCQSIMSEQLKQEDDDTLLDIHDDVCNALDALCPGWSE